MIRFLCLGFIFIGHLFAGDGYWSIPFSLTDSSTNNTNCTVSIIEFGDDPDSLFLFWEKSFEDGFTSLYYRDLNSMSEEKCIISKEQTNYKNPQILRDYNGSEVLFYLFYETDENGNSDIYYLKYLDGKGFSDPIPFQVSDKEEQNLRCTDYDVVWEQDGNILTSEFLVDDSFSVPDTISKGNCRHPVIQDYNVGIIAWEKVFNDSSKIFYSQKDYSRNWEPEDTLYFEGHNINLSFTNQRDMDNGGTNYCPPVLCWQTMDSSLWTIKCYDIESDESWDLDFAQESNNTEPSIFFVSVVSKSLSKNQYMPYESFFTFVSDTIPDNPEIFANNSIGGEDFNSISLNNTIDRNPRLFNGQEVAGYVINVWESYVNNHWQLFLSDIHFDIGAIDKNKNPTPSSIYLRQNFPNPFNPITRINYKLSKSGEISFAIYNNLGQRVKTLVDGWKAQGNYSVVWNGKNDNGQMVSSGLYYYKLSMNEQSVFKKMLLMR